LLVGAQDEGYIVKAALSDRDIVQLKLGDPAEIRMDAFPDQVMVGSLSEIAAAADERTGMFPVEVRFESVPVSLVSGLVAKLTLHPAAEREKNLPYVPITSVVEGDGNKATVFVLNGNRVKRRTVRIAFIGPESVALAEGLTPGEKVVTDGAAYLQDDERIEIVTDEKRSAGNRDFNAG
jgi:RND family efflux transporter MFP subunit